MEHQVAYPWENYETNLGAPPHMTMPQLAAPQAVLARAEEGRVALLWGEVPQADGYFIHRGEQPQGLMPLGTVAENSYTDAYTQPGKTYYYAVRAYNAQGQSAPSEIAAITVPAGTTPEEGQAKQLHQNCPPVEADRVPREPVHAETSGAAPQLMAPTGLRAFAQGTRFVGLSWQAPPGLGYRVYRSETPWRSYGLIAETTETHYLDTVPEPATRYYYFVQAVHQGRVSQASPMAEALTFPALPPPETPQNLRANPQGPEGIELRWNPARAAAAYVVYARLDPNDDFEIIGHTLDCGWLHEGLAPDSFVDYRVQAYHDSGASELSGVCTGRTGMRRESPRRPEPPNRGQGAAPMRFPAFSLNAFQRGMN